MMVAYSRDESRAPATTGASARPETGPAPLAAWLAGCRAGEASAWRHVYGLYFTRMFRFVRRLGASPRDGEDICQEVFVRAFRGLNTLRDDGLFEPWLYRIAVNEVSRAGRSAGLRRLIDTLVHREVRTAAPPPGTDALVQREQSCRELETILGNLKPKMRAVFVLHELEELEMPQVAHAVGCGLETARARLKKARGEFERLVRQRRLLEETRLGVGGSR